MGKKIGIFADVQNIYYTCKEAFGRNFDYNAFWDVVTDGNVVACAFAYAIDRGDSKQQEFQNILRAIGFTVKLKPFLQRRDGSTKGDWDVGVAIDILENAPDLDQVILLSGDGDFTILLDRIKAKHAVYTKVFGVKSLSAQSLIESADEFTEIHGNLLL